MRDTPLFFLLLLLLLLPSRLSEPKFELSFQELGEDLGGYGERVGGGYEVGQLPHNRWDNYCPSRKIVVILHHYQTVRPTLIELIPLRGVVQEFSCTPIKTNQHRGS